MSHLVVWEEMLTGHRTLSAETVEQIGQMLGAAYSAAEAAQDGQQMEVIAAAWQHVGALQQAGHQALSAGTAMLGEIDAQRAAIMQELSELLNAIEMGDKYHPRLMDWAQEIVEETEETVYEYASESIHEELYDQIYEHFRTLGFDYSETTTAMEILTGEVTLNEEQRELLKMLLDSAKEPRG